MIIKRKRQGYAVGSMEYNGQARTTMHFLSMLAALATVGTLMLLLLWNSALAESASGKPARTGERISVGSREATAKEAATEDELVTDAFFDNSYTDFYGNRCYYHIPQVNLDTPEVKQINRSLYDALYVKLFTPCVLEAPSPQINGIAYTWTVKDHFLSVIAAVRVTDGNMLYHYATLVDLKTGKSASVEDILSLYDMTMDDYYVIAQIMMDGELVRLNNGLDKDLVNRNFASQLSATLSWDNLSTIQPYIDAESGELCIAATLFDIYCQNLGQFRICLTSEKEPVDPFVYRDIFQEWDGDGAAAKPRRIKQIDQNFNEEELRAICDSLGVPRDLDVQITQGKPYYWEAGGIYRTEIEIYHNGKFIASALVNSTTGELAGAIWKFSASHLQ